MARGLSEPAGFGCVVGAGAVDKEYEAPQMHAQPSS